LSLLKTRIGTLLLLALFLTSAFAAVTPISDTNDRENLAQTTESGSSLASSSMDFAISYVDRHFGSADGIIDPTEYSRSFADTLTGVTAYAEHDGTYLYLGLQARTTGWIGVAWQNYTGTFTQAGLNNSDVISGYVPGSPTSAYWHARWTDAVTVHYKLWLRNGTMLQEGDAPDSTSDQTLQYLSDHNSMLQMYLDMIIGMRIGEIRHFVIPADQAYNSKAELLYGEDLEYEIQLTRIYREGATRTANPADGTHIVYSDEHGTSTYQHLADADQSRIVAADGTDNGTLTQLEYKILMNSTDSNDISLFNSTDVKFPFVLMMGMTEELNAVPAAHTYWSTPIEVNLVPNKAPILTVLSPADDANIEFVAKLSLNATDDFVRSALYRVDETKWKKLGYNFVSTLWESNVDFSEYEQGPHTIWFNATDSSNMTAVTHVNITIDRPYHALLGMKLDVSRQLVVAKHYGCRVTDTYVVTNNGSAPIGSIDVYLPMEWSENFLSIVPGADSGIHIVRLTDTDTMMRWRIYFSEQVGFQESSTFKTITYMHSLFWLTDAQSFEYRLQYIKYPMLPYVLREAQFALGFDQGSLVPNEESPDSTEYNLNPLSETSFDVLIRQISAENIVSDRATTIVLDAWGWLRYTEKISLDNTGGSTLDTFTFTLPSYSTDVKIYDEVGVLALSQRTVTGNWNESRSVTINLKGDRFGDLGFKPGYKYTFWISYIVLASPHQVAGSGGLDLQPPMGLLGDILVMTHTVDIVVTASVSVVDSTEGYRLLYGVFDTTQRYVAYNTTQRNPIDLHIIYSSTLGAAARPIIFSLVVGIIGLAYVAYRKVDLPEEVTGPRGDAFDTSQPQQTGAPPELLREFATVYSKKTALTMDLEKLEAARRRGKVTKREYMIREKDLKDQLGEIDSELPSLKTEMIKNGPKYRDIVAQLELQDERIEGAKAGLRQLLLRKKKQRISRVAFEKTRQDYLKTIQKATSASDRILLSVQEEAGDV
jgi:hypothetical protein